MPAIQQIWVRYSKRLEVMLAGCTNDMRNRTPPFGPLTRILPTKYKSERNEKIITKKEFEKL